MSHQLEAGGLVGANDGGHRTLYPGPVETSRDIYFVDGSVAAAADSTTTNGRNRQKPLATINYAVATAGAVAGAAVCVLATHRAASATATVDELLHVTMATDRVSVFGCGAGATRVTLKSDTTASIFTLTGVCCEVRNFILMDAPSDGTPVGIVDVSANGAVLGELDVRQAICPNAIRLLGGNYPLIENCTVSQTAGSNLTTLLTGILISNGVNRVHLEGTRVDGGTFGWRAGATGNGGVHLASGSTSHGFSSKDCTLVNGADFSFEGTVTGIIANLSMQRGCRLHSAVAFRYYSSGYLARAGGGNAMLNHGVWITGTPWWVNNTNTNASDANTGDQPERPLLTLQQALTNFNAQAGDIILVAAGHNEAVAGVVGLRVYAISKSDTKIFGFGSGVTRPQWTVTPAASGAGATQLFGLTGGVAGIHIDNLRCAASTYTNGTVQFIAGNTNHWLEVEGCSFTLGVNDSQAINLATGNPIMSRIKSCDATVSAYGPLYGFVTSGGSESSYMQLTDCTLDSGLDAGGRVIGFGSAAVSLGATGPMASALTNTLRNGADIAMTGSNLGIISGTIADAPAGVQA